MTRFLLLLVALLVCVATPSFAQLGGLGGLGQTSAQVSLIPSGTSNLPAGQYVMTNLNSGQSLYVVINASGQLLAQDPRFLQFSVQQGTAQTTPLGQTAPTQPAGFGGMLKQGLGNFLQNSLTPQPNQ